MATTTEMQDALDEIDRLRASRGRLLEALRPFASGGDWGKFLAWMTHGPPDNVRAITAVKEIVRWQAAADAAIEAEKGVGDG